MCVVRVSVTDLKEINKFLISLKLSIDFLNCGLERRKKNNTQKKSHALYLQGTTRITSCTNVRKNSHAKNVIVTLYTRISNEMNFTFN